jgi:hypothetical protein
MTCETRRTTPSSCCVDTALRPLLRAASIRTSSSRVDSGEATARHLWDLPPCDETFLVTEASMTPVALEHFRRRTFVFSVSDHQPWPWLAANGQSRGRLRALGIGAHVHVRFWRFVSGAIRWCFVGSDLAFTANQPYARGVVYEEDWRRLGDWGVPLELHWRKCDGALSRTSRSRISTARPHARRQTW